MLYFLLGLVIGGIVGIMLTSFFAVGAKADEDMEYLLKKIS